MRLLLPIRANAAAVNHSDSDRLGRTWTDSDMSPAVGGSHLLRPRPKAAAATPIDRGGGKGSVSTRPPRPKHACRV